MKNKLILSAGAIALLISSAYASPKGICPDPQFQKGGQACCSGSKMNMQDKKHKKNRVIGMIMGLNLSDAQRTQIRTIMVENIAEQNRTANAFTETSFDKAKYIAIKQQKRDNSIQKQADLIEKVYAVLTPEQKKELKIRLNSIRK